MIDYDMPFCYYHAKTAENPKGTDCAAYEGGKCRFTLMDIMYKRKKGRFIVRKGGPGPTGTGECMKFWEKGLKPELELSDALKEAPVDKKLVTLIMLIMDR